jgi:uncharacterized protein (UPF0335 family)
MGGVSFMMGLFATVVFNRQSIVEKDLRQYLEKLSVLEQEKNDEKVIET